MLTTACGNEASAPRKTPAELYAGTYQSFFVDSQTNDNRVLSYTLTVEADGTFTLKREGYEREIFGFWKSKQAGDSTELLCHTDYVAFDAPNGK